MEYLAKKYMDLQSTSIVCSDKSHFEDNEENDIYINNENNFGLDFASSANKKEMLGIEGGEYFLPSADKDIERLQMQHFLFRCVWNGNFSSHMQYAFINGGVKVLDVQCGSGIWVTDLASQFSTSTFIGIDDDESRSCIQIELPNAAFLHHDIVNGGLPFPDDTFDFVNQRFFNAAPENKWKKLILPEIVRVLKPGACLELMELMRWYNMGPVTKKMTKIYEEFMEKRGFYHLDPLLLQQTLASSGFFKEIYSDSMITPLWSGRASQLICQNQLQRIESNKSCMCKYMKISEEQFDDMIKTIIEEIHKFKSCCYSYRIYGRKR